MCFRLLLGIAALGLTMGSGAQPRPASDVTASAQPQSTARNYIFGGKVSFYGDEFAGRKTSSGEVFNPAGLTMAHKTLPFGTRVRVINLQNNRSVVVRVNDRGPGIADRVADLSTGAARELDMLRSGVVQARLEVLEG